MYKFQKFEDSYDLFQEPKNKNILELQSKIQEAWPILRKIIQKNGPQRITENNKEENNCNNIRNNFNVLLNASHLHFCTIHYQVIKIKFSLILMN